MNVDGSLNLAKQAARAGVKRLIYLSSVKVNGEYTLPGHPSVGVLLIALFLMPSMAYIFKPKFIFNEDR